MGKRLKKRSGVKGKLHRILFVGPKPGVRMEELAERLIELRLVQAIVLDEHEQGYLAKVWFFANSPPKNPAVYLSSQLSRDFGEVVRA